jgi:hypothetical protein
MTFINPKVDGVLDYLVRDRREVRFPATSTSVS